MDDKRIFIRKGVCLVHICGEHILIATREARKYCPFAKNINDSAAYYFEMIEQNYSADEIIQEVSEQCDIPAEQIRPVLDGFIDNLVKLGYLYREGAPEDERE